MGGATAYNAYLGARWLVERTERGGRRRGRGGILGSSVSLDIHVSLALSLGTWTRFIDRRRGVVLGAWYKDSMENVIYSAEEIPYKHHQYPSHSPPHHPSTKLSFFRFTSSNGRPATFLRVFFIGGLSSTFTLPLKLSHTVFSSC